MQHAYAQVLVLVLAVMWTTAAVACVSSDRHWPSQQSPDTMQCYPYLAINGQYGYANKQMDVVIAPSFRSASPFTSTGFAVVKDDQGRSGVIDKTGRLVVPFRYDIVRLEVVGNRTFARTARYYINRWHFWEWRFLPGFSITGGTSDNRLFDTAVKRARLKITVLETNQTLYSQRVPAASSYGHEFSIRPLDSLHLLQGNRLFQITDHSVRLLARNIVDIVDSTVLLQRRGSGFRLIDYEGKPKSGTEYIETDSLHTTINGLPRSIAVTSNRYDDGIHAKVFADNNGRQYIFPDFTKPFPASVDAIAVHGVATDNVLLAAQQISGMAGNDRFMIRWFNKPKSWFEYAMIDTAGHWHTDPPPGNEFRIMVPSGDILWPPASHIIPEEAVKSGCQVTSYGRIAEQLYDVTVKCGAKERMGLWDAQAGDWLWEPQHRYIRCLDFRRGYWTFKPDAESGYGLYHLPSRQVVIPPKYHDMSADGMVSYYDDKRGYIRFYVDWDTQQEYREHSNEYLDRETSIDRPHLPDVLRYNALFDYHLL